MGSRDPGLGLQMLRFLGINLTTVPHMVEDWARSMEPVSRRPALFLRNRWETVHERH